MGGKPTDVIEDWTYGPVRWIGAGLVVGAATVGLAWSVSARRVPAGTPPPIQPVLASEHKAEVQAAAKPEPGRASSPKPIVTELPPRDAPVMTQLQASPVKEEPVASAKKGPINVNTATAAELESLPGIGPGLAARIVEDREKNGRYKAVKDLDRVRGIGPKLLEKVRPFVVVD
ncbi:MAG: helix-hairpin-helix domain-containing protein [Phycisphaeraceae bacterium]|nr:helix-hairpin-helix domain-containing protein [Phycisphaeraceae bacterium]